MSRSAEQVVRDFCAAVERLDIDEVMDYFTDDATYHNVTATGEPSVGKAAVRESLGYLSEWERTRWEISSLAVSGNVVFAERVDRTDAGGRHVDLPLVGMFEIDGERIRHWRDYFDPAIFRQAMQPDA